MIAQFFVEIWRLKDGHVEERMGPMSERQVERVQCGAMINMNLDEWGCRIVGRDDAEPPK
jgi:hypothetical protein